MGRGARNAIKSVNSSVWSHEERDASDFIDRTGITGEDEDDEEEDIIREGSMEDIGDIDIGALGADDDEIDDTTTMNTAETANTAEESDDLKTAIKRHASELDENSKRLRNE